MSSNISKQNFSRSISVKPQKNAFEYGNDGELTTIYLNYPRELSRSTSTSKVSSKSQTKPIKYRKSSSRTNTPFNATRSSSYHALSSSNQILEDSSKNDHNYRQSNIQEKLKIISQQNFCILPQCSPTSFTVCAGSSSRYVVNIGPQTCCCLTKSSTSSNQHSFPCVHLLFIMCKVLQVHERDPLLLEKHLKNIEVDELFKRFNKRIKEKLNNPYRPNDKNCKNINHEEEHEGNTSRFGRDATSFGLQYKSVMKNMMAHVLEKCRNKNKHDCDEPRPNESLDEITCSICLQEMNIAQLLIFCHNCSNEFHKKCILIWLKECKKNNEELTCPLCRKSWPSDDISRDIVSPLEYGPSVADSNFFVPRSHSTATSFQHINHREITNIASSTSDLTSSNFSFNINGSKHGFSVSSNHKPIGYCFSALVAEMLSSDMSDKREAGLRQVAEQTVQIVVSAGSAYSVEDNKVNCMSDTISTDIVSSMGGFTTGLMLKEAFRVIARLLDDTSYTLFVGALRAFREILGYLICRTESEVERMSRMISPVLCQLLRICGDNSQKKKAQMCLSALFELANGQEGGMALGREIKKSSLPVTGWQRLAKFAIANHHRFKAVHCYGRLSLLERLLDKFELTLDILRKLLEFVTSQLLLMHRSMHLLNSFDSGKMDVLETTDVDTGLSTSDIRLLSGQRLQKLAKILFINTAKLMMSKLKFNGWSSHDVYVELWKDLNRLPQPWKEKFMIKLKIPWEKFINVELTEVDKSLQNREKKRPEVTPATVTPSCVSKSYRISKRYSQSKPVGAASKIGGIQSANSVNSLKVRTGSVSQTIRSASSGSCRISPFIRITPEPAYDAVPLSESEDDISHETSSVFFSELAIHNSIYGHQFGLQESSSDERNEEEEMKRTNAIFRKILAEQTNSMDRKDSLDIESQPPPGLGVFSSEYRSGYEWCQGPLLGTGAFSKCYQGRDVRTGLLMAVKQISISHSSIDKNEEIIKAVKTEVNLMIQLNHPNVLPLLGAMFSPTDNIISMFVRWMPGGSVASLLNQYSAFLEPVTLAYALQTARGLSYIHSNRILHRDLKGANLLLDSSGMRLRISDFGASARLSNGRDSNASDFKGQLLGTVAFMAPEVLRGEEYGRSCDVWSFACCIIEMLTGSQPWRDRNHTNHLALMYTIASAEEPPKLPEQISADLTELLTDCLNRDPKKRPLSSKLESYRVFKHLTS